ncbi:DUF6452 family protein [Flavivirga algicola]|uniref:Lipoprotein n=1 Tax=Flavivirga algicola TaxID=2729136 RepID=A0ABX1RTQ4_9FLAO|nr:DUF6452 family protein [Flavivirga algicola]NMH86088.1 hypothetical protein [Flavivirga algicola]
MKYFKILVIPLLFVVAISISCERDDICPDSTPTTPRLIIDLLDNNNTDNKKRVFDLVAIGVDNEFVLPDYNFSNTDNLVLPLKTDENTTQYILVKEATVNDAGTPDDTTDDFIDGNQDTITINYSRKEVYVSRACGYKTIFENVTLTIEPDADNWILTRQPLTDNQSVEDEAAAHFTMSH